MWEFIFGFCFPRRALCGIVNKCRTTYYGDTWIAFLPHHLILLLFHLFDSYLTLCQFDIHQIKCARSSNVSIVSVSHSPSFYLHLCAHTICYELEAILYWYGISEQMNHRPPFDSRVKWINRIVAVAVPCILICSFSFSAFHRIALHIIHNILICRIFIGTSRAREIPIFLSLQFVWHCATLIVIGSAAKDSNNTVHVRCHLYVIKASDLVWVTVKYSRKLSLRCAEKLICSI